MPPTKSYDLWEDRLLVGDFINYKFRQFSLLSTFFGALCLHASSLSSQPDLRHRKREGFGEKGAAKSWCGIG
jgi:hypothetical protein